MNIPILKVIPKECPWCHDMPTLVKYPLWDEYHGYFGKYEYYIACQNVKCKIHPRTKKYNDIYDMTEEKCIENAIDDWNNR